MTVCSSSRESASFARALSIEEAWALAQSKLDAAGITRLADVTRLDVIGIPTWQAIRPCALTLSVSQGKGRSHLEARVSAAMEAIEHASWESYRPALRWASARSFPPGKVVDTSRLCDMVHGTLSQSATIPWAQAEDLISGGETWFPADLVSVPRPGARRERVRCGFASTNGLAAGASLDEATVHALLEAIERDAQECAQCLLERDGIPRPRMAPESFHSQEVRQLQDAIREAGLSCLIFSNENEFQLPCYSAYILDEEQLGLTNVGHGAHIEPGAAAARAIAEAAQGRITMISGSREDNFRADYRFLYEVGAGLTARANYEAALCTDFVSAPVTNVLGLASPHDALAFLLDRLVGAGWGSVLRVEITNSHIGVPVAKVIVPGFSGYHSPLDGRLSEYRDWRMKKLEIVS